MIPLVLKEGLDLKVKIDYRGKMSDEAAYALSFSLNINRKDVTPAQVGASCARLKAYQWSEAQIAKHLGKSPAWVRDRIALSVAPMEVQNAVAAGTLPIDVGAKLSSAPAEKVRRVLDKSKTGQRGSARRELSGVNRFSKAGIQAELDRRGQPKTCCDLAVNAMLLRLLEGPTKEG
jgi:ParB family chromosome partitioning protein